MKSLGRRFYFVIFLILLATSIFTASLFTEVSITADDIISAFAPSIFLGVVSCAWMHGLIRVFNLTQPTIPGFFFLTYLLIMWAPAFLVYLGNPGQYRQTYFWAVNSVLLTVPAGIAIVNSALQFRVGDIQAFFERPIQEAPITTQRSLAFVGLLGAGFLATAVYVMTLKTIPILYLFTNPGDYDQVSILRQLAAAELDSWSVYLYYYFMILIYPFLTMVSFGYFLATRRRYWMMLFLATLFLTVAHCSITTAKSPVTQTIFTLCLFTFLYFGGKVRARFMVYALPLILLFPFAVTYTMYLGTGMGLNHVALALGKRVFFGPSWLLYMYHEVFPDIVPFLYGRSIEKFALLMGWEYYNVPVFIGQHLNPGALTQSGNANVAFIGTLYADFGFVGVIGGGVLAGSIMQFMQVYLFRQRKTVINLAILAFLIVTFHLLNHTALPPIMLSYGAVYVLILGWTLREAERGVARL